VGNLTIGYFLEDLGHENFICSLTERLLRTSLQDREMYIIRDVRNATGGAPRALRELERFLRDCQRAVESPYDFLVVAIDANSEHHQQKKKMVQRIVTSSGYESNVLYAIPDPYIERWYLADPQALARAVPGASACALPKRRCKKNHYKELLAKALAIINPQLGGREYGPDIVAQMDLYAAAKADPSLRDFLQQIKDAVVPSD
jgi:hypothetical protein